MGTAPSVFASIDEQTIPTEMACALDIGSKNVKLVRGYLVDGRLHTQLLDKITLNLGTEVNQSGGAIGPAKRAEIETLLGTTAAYCRRQGITTCLAIATNAVSQATNNGEIVALARQAGIALEIADGRREGEVGYLAATRGKPHHLVAELGSQSCQIAWDTGAGIEVTPLSFGYRRLYEQFFQEEPTFEAAASTLRSFFARHIPLLPRATAAFVALAANSLAGFVTNRKKHLVSGEPLPRTAITRTQEALAQLTTADFEHIKRHTRKAEKILPGLVFMEYMLEKTEHEAVLIAEAELPVGLLVEYFHRTKKPAASHPSTSQQALPFTIQ